MQNTYFTSFRMNNTYFLLNKKYYRAHSHKISPPYFA